MLKGGKRELNKLSCKTQEETVFIKIHFLKVSVAEGVQQQISCKFYVFFKGLAFELLEQRRTLERLHNCVYPAVYDIRMMHGIIQICRY